MELWRTPLPSLQLPVSQGFDVKYMLSHIKLHKGAGTTRLCDMQLLLGVYRPKAIESAVQISEDFENIARDGR